MRTSQALTVVTPLLSSQLGACSRRQASERGLGAKHVARLKALHVLDEPVPGVLVVRGAPPSWRLDLMMATLAAGGRPVATDRSSAALHGFDGYPEGPVDVAVPAGSPHLQIPGATVHRLDRLAGHLTTVDGIRCLNIAATLVRLGDVDPAARVQKALDSVRRRNVSLAWLRDEAESLRRPGQKGSRILLELLEEARIRPVVPGSWLERLLELAIADPSLPAIVRQHAIHSSVTGRVVAVTDLAFPNLRLGVEGHSRQFHFGAVAEAADEDRDLAAAEEGWDLLYLGWHAAMKPEDAHRRVRRVALARAKLLGVELPRAS
jgi:hypothetical protein